MSSWGRIKPLSTSRVITCWQLCKRPVGALFGTFRPIVPYLATQSLREVSSILPPKRLCMPFVPVRDSSSGTRPLKTACYGGNPSSVLGSSRWPWQMGRLPPGRPALVDRCGALLSRMRRCLPRRSHREWSSRTAAVDRSWQAATGTGFLPPLVVGDVVYTGSQYGPLEARRVEDGSLLWRYLPGSLPLVVMTVAQETVYLGSSLGTVEAVSADTGSVRWRYDADGPISDITQDAHAAVVIGSGNGFIARLREETGSLLWQASSLGEPPPGGRAPAWGAC